MTGHWRRRGSGIELRAYAGRDPLTGRKRYATRTIPPVGKREADKALSAFVAELAAGQVSTRGAGMGRDPTGQCWLPTATRDGYRLRMGSD